MFRLVLSEERKLFGGGIIRDYTIVNERDGVAARVYGDVFVKVWAIVALFGHKKIAGRIQPSARFGDELVRIDVPKTKRFDAFTREYGVNAIYEIDYVSEEIARIAAEEIAERPVLVYAPELITRDAHDEIVAQLKQQIDGLRMRALDEPAPRQRQATSEDDEDWSRED